MIKDQNNLAIAKVFWRMKSRIKPNCKQSYFNSKASNVNLCFSKSASLLQFFSHNAKTMQWWNIGFILCDRSFMLSTVSLLLTLTSSIIIYMTTNILFLLFSLFVTLQLSSGTARRANGGFHPWLLAVGGASTFTTHCSNL